MDSLYLTESAVDNQSLEKLLTPVLKNAFAAGRAQERQTRSKPRPGLVNSEWKRGHPVVRGLGDNSGTDLSPGAIAGRSDSCGNADLAEEHGDRKNYGPLQILDLACGACRELEAVSASLQNAVPGRNREVRFVGADIRGAQLEEAKERARRLASSQFHTEFFNADCSKLKHHLQIGKEFDMIFLRHQNYWENPVIWRRIFEEGLDRLHETGLLVITSYFDKEHELAIKAITSAGTRLVASVRNAGSRQLGTRGKSVDRHLAVFRRK